MSDQRSKVLFVSVLDAGRSPRVRVIRDAIDVRVQSLVAELLA